jgi:hypothetical protein
MIWFAFILKHFFEQATVACNSLGFQGALSAKTNSFFGYVAGIFAYDEVIV